MKKEAINWPQIGTAVLTMLIAANNVYSYAKQAKALKSAIKAQGA